MTFASSVWSRSVLNHLCMIDVVGFFEFLLTLLSVPFHFLGKLWLFCGF